MVLFAGCYQFSGFFDSPINELYCSIVLSYKIKYVFLIRFYRIIILFRLTDFLSDAGERIAILRVVHRRVHNRYNKQNFSNTRLVVYSSLFN